MAKTFRCQVVTPERVVLDKETTFVALPAFDGELGVLAGRAPLIARLGSGELRVEGPGGKERLFVSGGFAQMASDRLTLLTEEARAIAELTKGAVAADLDKALAMASAGEAAAGAKERAVTRARAKLRLASRAVN